MRPQETYAAVRGFNFQPPWGSNGRDVWRYFDPAEYRRILQMAKAAFPGMNTVRVWLSFDAWYDLREKAVENMRTAGEILASEGLKMIPMYFNGWHSVPDFGGISEEMLRLEESVGWQPFLRYLRETASALEDTGAVLLSDLCNEPFNNTRENHTDLLRNRRFLNAMAAGLREVSRTPVTVGSQGYYAPFPGAASDMEFLKDTVDVFTLHPYIVAMTPTEQHLEWCRKLLATAEELGKPVIITECCWGADTDEERGKIVDLELGHYADLGIGFLVHALYPSPVADLHPLDGVNPSMYMPFLLEDGSIRPYHEVFNRY